MSRKMKESGIDWIGRIPKSWNTIKFRYLHGGMNTGEGIDKNFWSNEPTDRLFYTAGINPIRTNYEDFPEWKYTKENDLLLARNGTPYIYIPYSNACYTDHIIRATMNASVNKRFVQYGLQCSIASVVVDSVSLATWSASLWNKQVIAWSSAEEQERIVSFLDEKCAHIDSVLEKTRNSIEEYKNLKQSIITQAVTNGIASGRLMKESGVDWIGKVPEDWKVTQLRHCASIRSGITLGKTYSKDTELFEMPYLRVANVQDGYVDTNDTAILRVSKDEIEKYSLSVGEVLMTEGGDRDKLGRGCVWDGRIAPCLHQNHIFAVKVKEKLLNPYYLEYLTVSAVGRTYFDVTAVKTTNLACTSSSKVLAFTIPLPSLDEQNEIVSYLKEKCNYIDDVITKKEQFVNELENYKKSLIYEYVTGKKEVPES